MKAVRFKSKLEVTESSPPWHILRVPKAKVADFSFKENLRRVICTLNETETFNCSLFPSKGDYFITVSKKLRDKLRLEIGKQVVVEIARDESQFGMPMPEEFAEVMRARSRGRTSFQRAGAG